MEIETHSNTQFSTQEQTRGLNAFVNNLTSLFNANRAFVIMMN
jgi:hypothetical protein